MDFAKFLKENKIAYKEKGYKPNIKLYKIGEKKPINVAAIYNSNNIFMVDRDLFFYLNNQKENYSFLLFDTSEKKTYYLEFKNKTNWLASAFERTNKEKLYFGKVVLNYKTNEVELMKKLKQY